MEDDCGIGMSWIIRFNPDLSIEPAIGSLGETFNDEYRMSYAHLLHLNDDGLMSIAVAMMMTGIKYVGGNRGLERQHLVDLLNDLRYTFRRMTA